MVRKEQNIAIAIASSGIAATLLAEGRTAHSVLKLPLTFAEGQTAVCNIRKNSDKALLLRSCKFLVWDECTMAHKIALEALDRTLRDIRDDSQPIGGLVMLLASDLRQTLLVVTRGTPADELNACLKSSYLCSQIVKMHLTGNMRVQLHNDTTAAQFADYLLKIGEGRLETDSESNIQFSNTFCQVVESSESLYESVPKLYNIKRHYEQHKSKYVTYEGLMRQEKLKEFKLGMKKQQFMFTKVSQESEAAVHASYVLSEMIAKHSKPFTEGDFIKECLIKAAEIVCPGSVKTFQTISFSRNTVVERVTDMARNLNDRIKEKSSCFEAFSIACDEIPMHGTTTGEDIFNCVNDILQKYNLPQSKLTSVATDGAPSMTGKTNGFVALLRKKLSEISDGSNIHHTHCIIHQEVLCTKVIKMENVLTPIKKFINFIRSRGLNQRQFSLFLTELESKYSGLSYYTEVRWLSCSKVLKQFWDLKEEICHFLITKNQDITLFSDQVWLQDFSFVVDIT
ncbi:hypothetical protein LAZ67_11000925 [Cordylochernes scorpioides]|uniref:ATP-dependent DNA helicase n=1 Tax=Cordylochernes scorpioides TaxID=51811 RepID=A0ABY6KY38_9ARAC|nr:hypothetical protein LAZ67_11000925 [Cordylochernes scorpioides]